ncbi:hypothetical protein AM372_00920 (plasmid) [Klebsiella pneumoniae]|nr:hypothetical protein AM359_01550 [Klebsiella pneumoniae]ASA02143.1 hypothetical protein AM360_28925 [Klebsiella pneumoniae]ASB10187.1 hypothetical protein AM372_00920 [Klebsiella pneumoniae]
MVGRRNRSRSTRNRPVTGECITTGQRLGNEPRQPGGCKLKTAPVRPVVAARPAEYVCSEDLFY